MTDQEKEELEKVLVSKVHAYFRLLDSGMLSGKFGNLEARRRKEEIRDIRERLGLTKKQQTALVNKYTAMEGGT